RRCAPGRMVGRTRWPESRGWIASAYLSGGCGTGRLTAVPRYPIQADWSTLGGPGEAVARYRRIFSRATAKVGPLTVTGWITHSARDSARADGDAMPISRVVERSMRDFPQAGTMDDQDDEMLPGAPRLLGRLFHQGLAVLAHRQDPPVVNDDGLP